jgi:hypothetical protein
MEGRIGGISSVKLPAFRGVATDHANDERRERLL